MKTDQPFDFEPYLSKAGELPQLFDPLLDVLVHIEALADNPGQQGLARAGDIP